MQGEFYLLDRIKLNSHSGVKVCSRNLYLFCNLVSMEIQSGKEIIHKTTEDIPGLVQIIKTKEQEIQNVLTQENEKSPLNLKGRTYETFQKTRKEILATLHILDTL